MSLPAQLHQQKYRNIEGERDILRSRGLGDYVFLNSPPTVLQNIDDRKIQRRDPIPPCCLAECDAPQRRGYPNK